MTNDAIAAKIKKLMQAGGMYNYPQPTNTWDNLTPFLTQPSQYNFPPVDMATPTSAPNITAPTQRQPVSSAFPQGLPQPQIINTAPTAQEQLGYQETIPQAAPMANITENTTVNKQFYNPYTGVNLESALFTLGQSLGYEGENRGANTLRGIASAGKVGLSAARSILSGAGYQKSNDTAYADYINQLYNAAPYMQSYQEGGEVTNAAMMTGAYLGDMGQGQPIEVEAGEVVQNSQTGQIQQVVGEKHSEGGVNVDLPDGSKVLSDYTKIGAAKAKYFRKELDIKVKATDTYASVMDKFEKKIGWKALIEQEEETIEEIGEQEQSDIQSATKDLNLNALSTTLQEIQQKKELATPVQQEAFNKIFDKQEDTKPKEEQPSEMMEYGGIVEMAKKHNITPERMMELVNQAQGQQFMQPGGTTGDPLAGIITQSRYAQEPYGYQPFLPNTTNAAGLANQQELLTRLQYQSQQLPYLIPNSGLYSEGISEPDLTRTAVFQGSYDDYVQAAADAVEINPYFTDEQKPAARELILGRRLGISNKNGQYDNVYGQETSSRSSIALPYLQKTDKEKYPDLKFLGDVIDSEGNIKEEYAGLDENTKKLIADTYVKSGRSALNIGLLEIPTAEATATSETATTSPTAINRQVTELSNLNMPVDYILPPSPAQPVYKASASLSRIDPTKVSVEPNLIEADRQLQSATDALSFLPEGQRAAVIASLLGQTQTATNQAITQAESINAQAQNQADIYNAQQSDKQQLLENQFNIDYEGKVFQTQANQERDLRAFFNEMNNAQNFRYNMIERRNIFNQAPLDFKITGNGIEFEDSNGRILTLTPTQMAQMYPTLSPEYKKEYQKHVAREMAKKDVKK